MKKANVIIVLAALLVSSGCGLNNIKWEDQERFQIQEYLDNIDDTVYTVKSSGLYFYEISPGTGENPASNDTVFFKYKGRFLNYQLFDMNQPVNVPFEAVLGTGQLLGGIDEALRYMTEGSKAKVITPSSLAYGPGGVYGIIPGYTPLLWELQLDSIIWGK